MKRIVEGTTGQTDYVALVKEMTWWVGRGLANFIALRRVQEHHGFDDKTCTRLLWEFFEPVDSREKVRV